MAYIDMEIDTANLITLKPILSALRAMDKLKPGQVLKITTYGAKSVSNFEKLCQQLGHKLMEIVNWDDEYTLLVKKAIH